MSKADCMEKTPPVPTEIRLAKSKDFLTVSFDSGDQFDLSAEYLRVFSPSAEVQGHSPDQRKLQYGKSGVLIMGVEPVGNYAVRLEYTDGHKTGLYTWVYLHKLGSEYEELWDEYLGELEQSGYSR